jgi:hypothetical protein
MRLEQRVGRVDRIGQRHRVHVVHVVGSNTKEVLLLDRLTARVSLAQARVRATSPLCGRPEWTEESSARLVVCEDETPERASPPMAVPPVPLTRLEPQAFDESRRIALQREVAGASALRRRPAAGDGAHPRGDRRRTASLLCLTRRSALRTALRGGALIVFRTRMVDASGRSVSTRVDAVLCRRRPNGMATLNAEGAARVLMRSSSLAKWRRESIEAHQALTAMRARRAAAILARLEHRGDERQPGLFDRRVERAWSDWTRQQAASIAAAADRLAHAQSAAGVVVAAPEPALLLVVTR